MEFQMKLPRGQQLRYETRTRISPKRCLECLLPD
jgi:hypothetical protein